MTVASDPHTQQPRAGFRTRNLLLFAMSMGALTGFLEGAGLYGAQAGRWIGHGIFGSTAEPYILYLSPLFALLVFAGVALLLQAYFLVSRTAEVTRVHVVFGVLAFLAFFDWIWLSERFAAYSGFILALGLACASERWFRRHWRRALELSPKMFAASAAYLCVAALGVSLMAWRREAAVQAALPAPRAGSPNIVLVILDTVRADHLSAYGYERKTTPYLEKLSEEGTAFDNAVAPSSWTFPSHVSMLTGRYPHEHGAVLNAYDGRYATVASSFDQMGYLTGGFSGNMDWFAAARGMAGGFQHFEDAYWSVGGRFAQTGYGRLLGGVLAWASANRYVLGYKRARDVNRTALRWLDAAPKRPFFLVLNYYDANAGGAVPEPAYRRMFSSAPLLPPARDAGEFTPGEIDKTRSNEYDGALVYMDRCVRELVEALSKRGLAENLVVVVTADHGEMLGEHELLGHRNALYWDLLRVPLIFWGSRAVPRGLRIERPVSLVSLPATLLQIAGENGTGGFPAPSLAQLWNARGEVPAWPLPISELAQMEYPGLEKNPNYSGSLAALVTPHWLLIDHSVNGPALYDWPGDPENLRDLAATAGGEGFATALTGCLDAKNASLPGAGCPVEDFPKPKPVGSSETLGAAGED
jgi:arylsulfatase A-like enzyme